ncbi:MAG: type I-U CRISPR-associated helicase/endonuclease Cas3 [Planctomycetes bacterium]|nr:type I-U CRISPR-associated helicase/endonuclease Cas3 [Planctomycetota bacterium]
MSRQPTSSTSTHVDELSRDWLRTALGLDSDESPFPWQCELLRRFCQGVPVSALDIPTGLGKTGTMAVWLVARALQAPIPRRLVYVVDRRAVVDQATEVAEALRAWVGENPLVARALGLGAQPLPISTLRGQHVDNRAWLQDPSSPAIVVGTVDMVGSRLLFEGYGVSRRMRPYHAGLLGVDAMVVLDEAHLVPPFERLLEAIERGTEPGGPFASKGDGADLMPRLRVMSLSATGQQRRDALTLSDADRAHPIVARRLEARKCLTVRAPVSGDQLAANLADAAWSLSGGEPRRVIVFATSRDVAQVVSELLTKRGAEVELLVGARRVFERTQVSAWLAAHGFVHAEDGQLATPSAPAFLVATSAGEVGVDMDSDHMVCDLVAWERMVQRLGRVNRRGEGDARVIVVPESDAGDAERLELVKALLLRLPAVNGGHEAGPGALSQLRAAAGDAIAAASSPAPLHPPLSRAVLESWSMTSLEEHTGRPEVQPWIRGWVDEEKPQTEVLFRRELPISDEGTRLADAAVAVYLDVAPPHLMEKLETETWRVLKWLEARSRTLATVHATTDEGESTALARDALVGLVLQGTTVTREVRLADLDSKPGREQLGVALEGKVLLLDARIGGLRQGLLDVAHPVASDVGQEGSLPFRISRVGDAGLGEVAGERRLREEASLCVAEADGVESRWLVIETLPSESAESEEGRSVARARSQLLEEHEEWTEREARSLAARLQLGEPYVSVLALAARLHDEGKRARGWQRAFGVNDAELENGRVYGKTTSRPNLALLARYRHELGSIPRAESDPRVQALSSDLRDLCLHLIAAHHGFARPLLRTDGAEMPQSVLVGRAQQIALRFTRLERTWGPWGLAWWEALLRAADQRASRLNDEAGNHD